MNSRVDISIDTNKLTNEEVIVLHRIIQKADRVGETDDLSIEAFIAQALINQAETDRALAR